MMISHIISDAVLAAMGVGVFWHYVQRMRFFDRLLWGFFLLTTALAALTGMVGFAGIAGLEATQRSLATLSDTLGMLCAVVGVWGLLNRQPISGTPFLTTILTGLSLFFLLSLPDFAPFVQVTQAVGILALMLLGTLGMLRQHRRAAWVIGAALVLGLATKAEAVSLLHPTDFYHYAVALALLMLGKAVEVNSGTVDQ
jgi:hypothetical protein